MINLPIFRAKRLYSDEYVFGVPRQDSKGMCEMIINVVEDGIAGVIQRYIEIDTISIHFPDMVDSQGNKIFASLQKNGRGGDIVEIKQPYRITQTHTGDNIPMGSYTEPLEANIEIIISPTIFSNGLVSLYSDIIDEYSYPLRYRLETKDIQMIKDCFQNGWGLDWSNNEDSDKNYIFSKYKLSSDDELVEFCKPKIIGIQQ